MLNIYITILPCPKQVKEIPLMSLELLYFADLYPNCSSS